MNTGLARTLWNQNQDLAEACLAHPFVQGIGTGALDRPTFEAYIAQDAYFLEAFARAYALALAHAPDRDGLYAFAEMLQGALQELRLHAGYAGRWGIDLTATSPKPETLHYTDFLFATAFRGDAGLTCAAMTPCMRLYAYLGQQLDQVFPDADHAYAEWIHTYRDPGFEDLARTLEDLLDRYAEHAPATHETYRRAMELEFAFFDGREGSEQ